MSNNSKEERAVAPRFREEGFYLFSRGLSAIVILLLAAIIVSLAFMGWPALHKFGLHFVTTNNWDPSNESFGALSAVSGTLIVSAIALVIGIPFSTAIALCITLILAPRVRRLMQLLVDLMAGIPSIIYGMWGLFVVAPIMQLHVGPWIISHLGHWPLIGGLFAGPAFGVGILTAGIILALMIIPTMASMMADIIATTPKAVIEASSSLGITRFALVLHVIFPRIRKGLIGSCMLGLGRALGETMAVTFVIGNSHFLTTNLFQPGTTIAATIANELNEALGSIYVSSLMALAFLLFLITFVVILCSRLLLLGYKH